MSHTRVILRRLRTAPFATAIALTGINNAVNLALRPRTIPQHALLSPFDYMSVTIYGIGGLLIIIGLAAAHSDIEAAGCLLFAGGALIAATAWVALVGWAAWNQILVLMVFAGAAVQRADHLAKGRILVLVQLHEDGPAQVVSDVD